VAAQVRVAFLGNCLWVCLKKKAQRRAPRLSSWPPLDQLGRRALVEGWFEDGRRMFRPRITQPEPAQAVLLAQPNWSLPQQPSPTCPRVYANDLPPAGPELTVPGQTA